MIVVLYIGLFFRYILIHVDWCPSPHPAPKAPALRPNFVLPVLLCCAVSYLESPPPFFFKYESSPELLKLAVDPGGGGSGACPSAPVKNSHKKMFVGPPLWKSWIFHWKWGSDVELVEKMLDTESRGVESPAHAVMTVCCEQEKVVSCGVFV